MQAAVRLLRHTQGHSVASVLPHAFLQRDQVSDTGRTRYSHPSCSCTWCGSMLWCTIALVLLQSSIRLSFLSILAALAKACALVVAILCVGTLLSSWA